MHPFGIVVLAPFAALSAQPPRQPNAAELARAIDRLSVVGNVLYVAAHPDDENTRLLGWLANEKLARTAYLSLTRGDGGQNLIGSEQGPLLGLIRTQELLAARRVDGAEQYFTRARDFGYSKTPDETLAIWGRAEVLADVVWAIRRFKPDVIITRFSPKSVDTHGHHTASALLAEEAFHAAADPAFHPEQVKEVGVWQAKRIVWNKGVWNANPGEDLSAFLKLDVGAFNPALGVSYGELAATSRSMHKSQGFGAASTRGPSPEYFQVLAGDPMTHGLFDGVDQSWSRVRGAEKLRELFARARAQYRPEAPESAIPALLGAQAALDALPVNPWKAEKQHELGDVIAACAGLYVEATAADFSAAPGTELKVAVSAINRSGAQLALKEVRLPGGVVARLDQPLGHEPFLLERAVTVPPETPFSNPYWLAEAPEPGLYRAPDPALIGLPEQPPALTVELVLRAGDRTLTVTRAVAYKWTDPVAGERWRPLEIVPAVMVNPATPVLMFPDAQPHALKVLLKAGVAKAKGVLAPELPAGWKAEPPSLPFALEDKGAEEELSFQVRPPAAPGSGKLRLVASVGEQKLARGVHRIEYGHIPIQTLFPEAEVKLVRFDLKKTKKRIGYIAGAGDEVAAALRQVGYEVTLLSDEALRNSPMTMYDAIVVGVRAYNTNIRLPYYKKRLMDYIKSGGTMVVQYNTTNRWSKPLPEIGPYPFEISQERVTDENAAITREPQDHPLLTRPNRILDEDFTGWIQERGLYFAGKWAKEYETPLSMHDPGEPARKGGVLVARYGKGAFIYTGLAFFRQLPAGVPGAYKIFANMISYGR
jgi:LmbE family N-acetylglucosaminyl deacetylase